MTTDPQDGGSLTSLPVRVNVQFSRPVRLSSLQAADLTVDGMPAAAIEVLAPDQAVFDLPATLGEGVHDLAIAVGAVLDLQGTPIDPFASTFLLDTIPYMLTLLVLMAWGGTRKHTAPASLGRVYQGGQQ